jgi:hypothetical protein
MNKKQRSLCIAPSILAPLLALTLLAMASTAFGQSRTDMPLQFQMKGEFYDPQKDPNAGGVNRFEVNVGDKEWILDIERADALQGSILGSSVLKKIYPPIITFVGPKELTDQLKNPEIEGKSYTLMGQLYVTKRMFTLTEVVNNEEKAETEAAAEGDSAAPPPASNNPGTTTD